MDVTVLDLISELNVFSIYHLKALKGISFYRYQVSKSAFPAPKGLKVAEHPPPHDAHNRE